MEQIKLIPINSDRKVELEKEVGHHVCSYTAEQVKQVGYAESYGIPVHLPGPKTFYLCAINGEDARGGQSLPFLPRVEPGSVTPCSEEYAKTCPLYRAVNVRSFDVSNCLGE